MCWLIPRYKTNKNAAYLSTSRSVLGSTAGDQLGVAVLEQVLVQSHVLFLGEDGIVGLDVVLLQHGIISTQFVSSESTIEAAAKNISYPTPWISTLVSSSTCINIYMNTHREEGSPSTGEGILEQQPFLRRNVDGKFNQLSCLKK